MKIAAFSAGVILPMAIVFPYLYHTLKAYDQANEEAKNVVVEEFTPSTVETFVVDYDEYGNMTLGEEFIRCSIRNNSANDQSCYVYLTDEDGNAITDKEFLYPAGRTGVLETTLSVEDTGEYSLKLMYEVSVGSGVSVIECPYKLLVNGGIK
jgi:hypothetical protein